MPEPEASVYSTKGWEKSGSAKTGADLKPV